MCRKCSRSPRRAGGSNLDRDHDHTYQHVGLHGRTGSCRGCVLKWPSRIIVVSGRRAPQKRELRLVPSSCPSPTRHRIRSHWWKHLPSGIDAGDPVRSLGRAFRTAPWPASACSSRLARRFASLSVSARRSNVNALPMYSAMCFMQPSRPHPPFRKFVAILLTSTGGCLFFAPEDRLPKTGKGL